MPGCDPPAFSPFGTSPAKNYDQAKCASVFSCLEPHSAGLEQGIGYLEPNQPGESETVDPEDMLPCATAMYTHSVGALLKRTAIAYQRNLALLHGSGWYIILVILVLHKYSRAQCGAETLWYVQRLSAYKTDRLGTGPGQETTGNGEGIFCMGVQACTDILPYIS